MLGVARSGVNRKPRPINDNDLEPIDGKQARHLMRRIGIEVLGRTESSKPAPGHKAYPYLLRGPSIEPPNRVWAADITYIPIGRGFFCLVAVIDGATSGSCLATVEDVGRFILRGSAGGGAGPRDDLLEARLPPAR